MNIPKLRAPIVLVHGLFGFNRLKVAGLTLANYFPGIPELLQQPGNRVLVPALSPTDGTAVRAQQLKEFINRESPHEPVQPGMRAIDIATGTGKVAASLGDVVGAQGWVVGIDVSPGMIDRARRAFGRRPELTFQVGDAMALPADDAEFDAATIAFGMRNLPDYGRGFAEMRRVVRPGGLVVCLEIARPDHLLARASRVWFERAVPVLGRLVGQGDAYGYLVESVRNYPGPERIATIMAEAGLEQVTWFPLTLGMVTVHVGRRPASR